MTKLIKPDDEDSQLLSFESLEVGDVVAIRGDLRLDINGRCQYTPDQLVLGQYVKHTGHGGIWTGPVERVEGDLALVAGGWRGLDRYEVMYRRKGVREH